MLYHQKRRNGQSRSLDFRDLKHVNVIFNDLFPKYFEHITPLVCAVYKTSSLSRARACTRIGRRTQALCVRLWHRKTFRRCRRRKRRF